MLTFTIHSGRERNGGFGTIIKNQMFCIICNILYFSREQHNMAIMHVNIQTRCTCWKCGVVLLVCYGHGILSRLILCSDINICAVHQAIYICGPLLMGLFINVYFYMQINFLWISKKLFNI